MKAKFVGAIVIELVFLLTVSHAQGQPVADPEAERILDQAAKAEGGNAVLDSLRTIRMTGSMYWGSSHLLGEVESIIKFPDKFRDIVTSSNGNILKYGFDGTEAWKRSTGGERSTGLPRLQLLLPAAQWRLRYTEARFVGQRKIGHSEAYVIRALVRGQTSPADYYYDAVNYLLLQVDTAAPEMPPLTYRVSSFHEIDGLKVPREWSFGENRTVIAIKLNIDLDDNQFAKPK
jgi:hypothetical protein